MAEFILEHWQLIASFVLALVNLIITLSVHAISSSRIKNGGTEGPGVNESLTALLSSSSAILEILKNEKKDQ